MKNINLFFAFMSLMLFSMSCRNDNLPELSNKENALSSNSMSFDKEVTYNFNNKNELYNTIWNDESIKTRSTIEVPSKFVSLLDKIQENDTILNQFTEEEKTYILNESITYYDILGLEDFIPNENFARLLNSKGEIIVNDSIYRITPWGTLCGKVEHRELIDNAYQKLQNESIDINFNDYSNKINDEVVLINSFNHTNYITEYNGTEMGSQAHSRTVTEQIPYNSFPRYSSESHTFVGKLTGKIFGDRSVKHHNFMPGYRVKGSLYDYDYGVYSEVGTFVAMRRKRRGVFKKINGWTGTNAQELSITYRGIVLEMKTGLPDRIEIPQKATLIRENVKLDLSGIGRQLFCVDICGKEITDAEVMKLAGTGLKTAMPILKKWLGREVNQQTQAVRILTQSKVYVVILDNQINSYNSDKLRKVFSSGVKFYISSNIISNPTSLKAAIDFMNGLKSLPVKRMKGGEVILAGKLDNRWGGMIIKKK